MRSRFHPVATVVGALLLASYVEAEENPPVLIPNEETNAFLATFVAVEEHPDCSGSGQLAFATKIDVSNLYYRAHDIKNGLAVDTGQTDRRNGPTCYITQRRGTDTMQIEFPCPEGRVTVLNEQLEALPISLNLRADVLSCMSPVGYRVIAGSWTMTAQSDEAVTVFEGSMQDTAGTRPPGSPSFNLDYAVDPPFYYRSGRAVHPLATQLATTTSIKLSFDCIPTIQESYASEPLYLETDVHLFLVDRPTQTCEGEDCPTMGLRSRYDSAYSAARACEPS